MIEYHKKDYGSVVVNKFRDYLWETEQSENTIDSYCTSANMFLSYTKAIDEKDVYSITKIIVRNFLEHLKNDEYENNKKYKISTINLRIAGINRFLEFVGLKDLKAKSLHIQRKSFINDNEILNDVELCKLFIETRNEDEDMFYMYRIMIQTGIRVSEIKYVTYESLGNGYVEIYNKGSSRRVPIPVDLKKELLDYCAKKDVINGSIFLNKNGKLIGKSKVIRIMKKIGKKLCIEIKKLHPHNFRHFFALKFIKTQGRNKISELADILGHKSIETTRIYLKSTLSDISLRTTLRSLKIRIAS